MKRKHVRFFLLPVCFLCCAVQGIFAQEYDSTTGSGSTPEQKYSPIKLGLAFESLHLWRGIEVNNTPCLESSVAFQTRDKSFNAGVWYNNAVSGTYKEVDYFASYTKKGLVVAVWDIFNFDDSAKYNHTQVFNYNAGQTGHFIDFDLGYTLQGHYPLSIYTSTVVWGRDRGWDNKKNLFSNYTQLTVPAVMNKEVNLSFIVGGAFAFRPDHNLNTEGQEVKGTFYTKKRNADFTNIAFVATRNITVLHHQFPVSGTVSWNPNFNQAHLMLSTVLF